jgi:hypothetical protein
MSAEILSRVRLVRRELQASELDQGLVRQVQDLLRALLQDAEARQLLPPRLVLVGPNNAGKSSLFAALGGGTLSPASSLGGATSRIHAALPAALVAGLQEAQPDWIVGESCGDSSNWLLLDTPDCDGRNPIHAEVARDAAEWADLLLVVVTPQSYSTEALRKFLEDLLDVDRPWCLLINGALDPGVAERQLNDLVQHLEAKPLALFWQPRLNPGEVLAPRRLPGGTDGAPMGLDQDLLPWLGSLAINGPFGVEARQLRSQRRDVLRRELVLKLRSLERQADSLEQEVRGELASIALEVAQSAMPLGVMVTALRSVLDRSCTTFQKQMRRGFQVLRNFSARQLPWVGQRAAFDPGVRLEEAERDALGLAWSRRSPALAALARRASHLSLSADRLAQIKQEGSAPRMAEVRLELGRSLDAQRDLAAYGVQVEELIEEELSGQTSKQLLQLGMDTVLLSPMAVAAVVVFHTGGLGADAVVGSMGAMGSAMLEKFIGYLGRNTADRARERWTHLAQARIGAMLEELGMPLTLASCDHASASCGRLSEALETLEPTS